jgi:riboflavin synthase alpha subunit
MFTGIVREIGRVAAAAVDANGLEVTIEAPLIAPSIDVGGSVSIDGVCLTAESAVGALMTFRAVPETLSRSTLGGLQPDDAVNLEPALCAGEPLGGHIVQGHVDGVGTVRSVAPEGEGSRVLIDAPVELLRYCVEKGSITVDGVSLTVASLDERGFGLALIPHTLAVTTLGSLVPGRAVNLEVDVLAKYVERLLAAR